MAVTGPDRIKVEGLPPATVDKFRGSNKEDRLLAGQALMRQGLILRSGSVLTQLGFDNSQRPHVSKLLNLLSLSHSESTESGWRYRDPQDRRRVSGFVDLNSPLPGFAEAVVNVGSDPSRLKDESLRSILANTGGSEVARLYIADSTFWNPSEMVKALTAEGKKSPLGLYSADQSFGWLLKLPRSVGLIGLHSSKMDDRHNMSVEIDIPGQAIINRKLRLVAEIAGVGFMIGTSVNPPQPLNR